MSLQVEPILRDPARLAALHELALLDSAIEPAFDRLARLATKLLGVPTALVTLVDQDRQFFKSCIGLPEPWASERQTPLSHSFCQYAVVMGEPFVVEDARVHPLVQANLAVSDLNVVAYAGIPLVTSDGFVIGSFCAIDSVPREWSQDDIATLRDLTSMVITEIELRSEIAERQRRAREREMLLEREQVARAEAEQAQRRFALLAETSSILAASFTYESTLPKLATHLRRALAVRCEIYLLTTEQQHQTLAALSEQPKAGQLLAASSIEQPFDPRWQQQPIVKVLQTQTSLFLPQLTAADWHALAAEADTRAPGACVLPTALMAVPIVGGHAVLGVLAFADTSPNPGWSIDDLALAEEIGRRIGMAVANAQLYRQSVQATRTRDDVLAVVSHDLRNPMQVMQIYASVLQQHTRRTGMNAAVIEEAVTQISAAGEKMAKLLSELTDVAMVQAEQSGGLARTQIDLIALVRDVVAQHLPTIKRHAIHIQTEQPTAMCAVDKARIERLLTNLLSNALKYSPDGGTIEITVGQADQELCTTLTVRDQGIGIPAADLQHIFEPFFRAGNVPSKIRGMGIGLTSVYQIVRQHGGTISVESTQGQGTTFSVRLPGSRSEH